MKEKNRTYHIARLRKGGKEFEILIVPEKAIEYRKGTNNDVRSALEVESIFNNARKGEKAAGLTRVFGTDDVLKIAGEIIKKGEIQLTSDYKKKLQKEKIVKIKNIITKYGIDPRTNLPIPMQRLELALEKISININPFRNAEEQVKDVLDKLRPIIPIRFEEKEIEGFVPAQYGGKLYGIIEKFGELMKNEWLKDGTWHFVVKIPGGMQNELFDKINSITHGNVDIKMR